MAEPGQMERLCAGFAGGEGAAELQEHRRGPGGNIRDSQLLCTVFVTKFLGSYLDANMQAVCSWLGGACVRAGHAPHDDLNPYNFQAAQHRLLQHIPRAGCLL